MYRPMVKQQRLTVRRVRVVTGYYSHTAWDIFKEATTDDRGLQLEEYTESVISYIDQCIDDAQNPQVLQQ